MDPCHYLHSHSFGLREGPVGAAKPRPHIPAGADLHARAGFHTGTDSHADLCADPRNDPRADACGHVDSSACACGLPGLFRGSG